MERHYRKHVNTMRQRTGGRAMSRPSPSSDATDNPQQHYSVAKKDRDHVDLYAFSNRCVGDPALKVSDATYHPSPPR